MDLELRTKLQTIGAAVAAVALVAAGGWLLGKFIAADDSSQSEAAATTTTAPPDPDAAAKAEIEDAWRKYLAMEERLLLAPNPDDPEIPQRVTGKSLAQLREVLTDYAAKGQVVRVGPATSQTILSIEVMGDEANLRACFVDESGLFDAATGAAIEPMDIGTEIDTTVLVREGGTWLISELRGPAEGEVWEGATACDQ